LFPIIKPRLIVRIPTRPKYINIMIISCAGILKLVVTPAVKPTVPNAETVSNSVATLFSNMADYTPDTDSEEGQAKYDAEAEAVNTVLQLAMDSADSEANALFNSAEGGEGRTGSTAEEFVDLLVNSQVVGQTLVTTVYEDGNTDNPYGVIPTEEDQEVLNEELLKYYEANKDNGDDQLMLKLNAVAIISGMEPIFDVEY